MLFLKEHLTKNYEWPVEDGTDIYTGNASRRKFDRFNGHQMLFLINLYGSELEKFTVNEGRRLEEMVMNQLPLEASSEISVLQWLHKTANTLSENKYS